MNVYFKQYDLQKDSYLDIYLKVVHICFGFDFGYFKYKTSKIKFVAKCLCILPWLIFMSPFLWRVIYFFFTDPVFEIWIILVCSQYGINVVILLSRPSDISLYQLSREIQAIDLKLSSQKSRMSVERKVILLIVFDLVYRVLLTTYSCFTFNICSKSLWIGINMNFTVLIANDIVLITNIYVFYAFYERLIFFTKNLTTCDNQIVPSHISLYKSIADNIEKFKNAYDEIVSIL